MIQQILAIAGLDNMDEFHKKYPTKEKFLKAYPEASRLFEKHEQEKFNPVKAYGGSMDHLDQMQYAKGGSVPQNAKLWSQAKALAKSKFDVYPSKYANNWAAKWYKSKGGTWNKAKYGGTMYADGGMNGQIGGRVDQLGHYDTSLNMGNRPARKPLQHEKDGGPLGHYDPSMDLRGSRPVRKPGMYEIGGVTAQGAGTHGQQYTIQNGVAVPMHAYGGYFQDGGENITREEAKSKMIEIIQKYAKMVGIPPQQLIDQLDKLEGHRAAQVLKKMAEQVQQAYSAGYADQELEDTGEQSGESQEEYRNGGIHLDPAKRGTFTAQATRMGMGVQEAARHILANKGSYSPGMVRKANFARNAAKWKHQEGGEAMAQEQMEAPQQQMQEQAMGQEQQGGGDQMMQQLMQMVAQALQQGADPQQVIQMLVQQGIPEDVATQVVQMVMQQMQGGAPQGGPGEQYQPQGQQYQGPQPQAAYGGMSDGIFYNESTNPY